MKRIKSLWALLLLVSGPNIASKGPVPTGTDHLLGLGMIQAAQQSPINQPAEIQDAQGNRVTPTTQPIFQQSGKNILIIHGWNQSPAGVRGLIDFVVSQGAHVLAYQYPTGASIAGTGLLLLNSLSTLVRPEVKFDIIAYSQGGLVARVATEPGALNGGRAFEDQVENLVTIATPHKGLDTAGINAYLRLAGLANLPQPQGLQEMSVGSMFLRTLNASPGQGYTNYFVIAGRNSLTGSDDALVSIDSAQGCGVLKTASQAILRLFHAPFFGQPSMPNHADVYAQIKGWIFSPPSVLCTNVTGNWAVSESGSLTCTVMGETYTDPVRGRENITVRDNGLCIFSYQLNDDNGRLVGVRSLTVQGDEFALSGIAGIPAQGFVVTENRFSGTGKVCGDAMTASGMGIFSGSRSGIPVSCTITTTAEFSRLRSITSPTDRKIIVGSAHARPVSYRELLTGVAVPVVTREQPEQ